ncbi:MAG: hypothetical protein QOC91_681 [Solirubrobacteraceae bacterium]|nr:hypothetical protein [Solirubrobacteraceae bacterium]
MSSLNLRAEQSRTLEHNYIGTEHILLGLLRARRGGWLPVFWAATVLRNPRKVELVGLEPTTSRLPAGRSPN